MRSPQSSRSSESSNLLSDAPSSGMHALFSFPTPFSLFPPSALISLTHNNKTTFLARPAAFGPGLQSTGLSGQVWIGSGFDDIASSSELGCSDVPGWSNSYSNLGYDSFDSQKESKSSFDLNSKVPSSMRTKLDVVLEKSSPNSKSWIDYFMPIKPATDEDLHHLSTAFESNEKNKKNFIKASENHSDIQSIQEAAEITGKVVLLRRGGCGFLEKVKWSQRRGAIAVIVGGNANGGPLIQMYARGDTSSITIPSVYTSYTTANIIYSLNTSRKPKGDKDDGHVNLNSNYKLKNQRIKNNLDLTSNSNKPEEINDPKVFKGDRGSSEIDKTKIAIISEKRGWFSSIFTSSNDMTSKVDQNRPPISGQHEWMLVDDWKVDKRVSLEIDLERREKLWDSKKIAKLDGKKTTANLKQKVVPDDNFVIGIQDWRDSDLVKNCKAEKFEHTKISPSSSLSNSVLEKTKDECVFAQSHLSGALAAKPEHISSLKGGSITPSSGEYTLDHHPSIKSPGIYSKDRSKDLTAVLRNDKEKIGTNLQIKYYSGNEDGKYQQDSEQHEGLWVTLSPSSGTSPFLDTLLVLIVSPLVTLTIVYVLLLIRSRYRQQKWRAPKSVVERLPVRTYQTINPTGSNSPRLPNFSGLSVTTPLLQGIPKPYFTSQTANNTSESSELIQKSIQNHNKTDKHRDCGHEKITSKLGACQNQTGTQTECVVCLEEYVDGVSRIMALPCGHEFHVECITPWLTTRRRTCPMCKGDVVRSLERATRYDTFKDDDNSDEEHDYDNLSQRVIHNSSSSGTFINNQSRSDLELGRPSELNHEADIAYSNVGWRGLFMGRMISMIRSMQARSEDPNR